MSDLPRVSCAHLCACVLYLPTAGGGQQSVSSAHPAGGGQQSVSSARPAGGGQQSLCSVGP